MANRTQIVCLHEGKKGRSIDPVFINRLIRSLSPAWIRPFRGSNLLRPIDCGGRKDLIKRMPDELKACLITGGQTTLMVWADLDDDMSDGDQLKAKFWETAQAAGINQEQFANVVFVFAKDRLENWIQYLNDGETDESTEGPRVKQNRTVSDAARKLAERCERMQTQPPLPPSLEWSCKNWRQLVDRMTSS
jgi:hypothetical protein